MPFNLRNHDEIQAVRSLLKNVDNITVHVVRIKAIDANRERFAPPDNIANGLNYVFSRLCFIIRGEKT